MLFRSELRRDDRTLGFDTNVMSDERVAADGHGSESGEDALVHVICDIGDAVQPASSLAGLPEISGTRSAKDRHRLTRSWQRGQPISASLSVRLSSSTARPLPAGRLCYAPRVLRARTGAVSSEGSLNGWAANG